MGPTDHGLTHLRQGTTRCLADLLGQQTRCRNDELATVNTPSTADPNVGTLTRAAITPQLGKVGVILRIESPD